MGTSTTQVQLAEERLQRTPTVYHCEHLVLGCVQPGMKREAEKERQKKLCSHQSLTADLGGQN